MSEDLFDTSESETWEQNTIVLSDSSEKSDADNNSTISPSDVSTISPEPFSFVEPDPVLPRQEATARFSLDLSTQVKFDVIYS